MKHILLLIATCIIIFSCGKTKDSRCQFVNCTEEFRMFNVEVVDTDGNKIELYGFRTINTKTNDTITFTRNEDTTYTVLDDSYLSNLYNQTVDFRFHGKLKSGVEFNEQYTFSADCCHVSKVSGNSTIVVNE